MTFIDTTPLALTTVQCLTNLKYPESVWTFIVVLSFQKQCVAMMMKFSVNPVNLMNENYDIALTMSSSCADPVLTLAGPG